MVTAGRAQPAAGPGRPQPAAGPGRPQPAVAFRRPQPMPAGWVRVDTHLHTVESGDAVTTLEQLGDRARAAGLDVVCVTDHNQVAAAQRAAGRLAGVRIVVGEEVRTTHGELIGLFLTERIPYVLPPREVVARIRAQGGLVCAPHPFDPIRSGIGGLLPELARTGQVDMIEVFNAKIADDAHNVTALDCARRFGLPGTAGSDAHDPAGIGAAYLEMPDFDGPAGFVESLRSARIMGEYRPHAPRYPVPAGP
jgi:hypothetical protein